jgi:hypothetical protein
VSNEQPTLAIVREHDLTDFAELVASRQTLVDHMRNQIEFLVTHYKISPEEAAKRARTPLPDDREEQLPEHVQWVEIVATLDADPERGQALWRRVKEEARRELRAGVRESLSLERPMRARPWERAQYLVISEALSEALQPRDGLERLLVQQMASAYEQHLRWQTVAVRRVEEEVWMGEHDRRNALEHMSPQQRERFQGREGWLPPRQADAEASEQAVLMADRYQRAFLRLMKAFRDNRRLFGMLVVTGGQVNVAERQVNVSAPNNESV